MNSTIFTPLRLLIVAAASFVIYAIGQGAVQSAGLIAFTLSLTIWASREIDQNQSRFRLALGAGALGALAVLLFFILNKL